MAKKPRTTHPSAAFGSAVHAQLETFLKGGDLNYFEELEGRIQGEAAHVAASALHLLPPPYTPGMRVEEGFFFTSAKNPSGPVNYRGFKDWYVPADSAHLVPLLEDPRFPVVGDHKTTSSFGWAKTPEELAHNAQAVIYAVEAMIVTGAEAVDLVWNYLQTKGARKSKRVHLRMYAEHASEVFSEIDLVVAEAVSNLEESKRWTGDVDDFVLSMQANPRACDAYGGCPFSHLCNLSPTERMMANLSQGTNSLLARLKAKQAGAAAVETVASVNTAPVVEAAAPVVEINPPERAPEPTPEQVEADKASGGSGVGVVAADAPKKRGRQPAGAKKGEQLPLPGVDVGAAPKFDRFTLYIDCLPIGLDGYEVLHLEKAYTEANAEIAKTEKVPDYRMVQYGAGPGMLATAVASIVAERAPGAVFVDTHTPEGAAVVSTLASKAGLVVRGVR